MTEEEREETKTSKPQELLSNEDFFQILRLELSGAKTIDDITSIAASYQAAIERATKLQFIQTLKTSQLTLMQLLGSQMMILFLACPYLRRWKLFTQMCISNGIWSQDHYNEMRIRIVLELAIHMDMYLDNDFLQLEFWPHGTKWYEHQLMKIYSLTNF